MTYPNSADVIAGQPTAADHYNNLRKDALQLGNLPADAVNLGSFLARHSEFIDIQYLATNRLRIPYATDRPPSLMINGFMLKAEANVDLPASLFSGAAATWYIFAVRNAGSTTFTLTVNTSAAEPPDQRLIGSCVWNGSSVVAIQCKVNPTSIFPEPDYDSGWFAVGNGTYNRAHGFGQTPKLVTLEWCANSAGTGTIVRPTVVYANAPAVGYYDVLSYDETNCTAKTGNDLAYDATCHSRMVNSAAGYYRLRAYR